MPQVHSIQTNRSRQSTLLNLFQRNSSSAANFSVSIFHLFVFTVFLLPNNQALPQSALTSLTNNDLLNRPHNWFTAGLDRGIVGTRTTLEATDWLQGNQKATTSRHGQQQIIWH